MIDRMSGRVALLLVSVALLLVVLLGWFVLIAPQRSKATKLDSQVSETNIQLASVTSLLEGPVGRQSLAALRVRRSRSPTTRRCRRSSASSRRCGFAAGVELDGDHAAAARPLDRRRGRCR